MTTAHLFRRLLLALASFACVASVTAAENPRSGVSLAVALQDAKQIAATRADLRVLRVEGNSMLPFFGSGAVLVVKQMPAAKLRVGMVVVYTNRFNETVAHRVISSTEGGWQVQGYNNTSADSTLVNDANLVGVVYATFHSNARADGSLVAAISGGTTVALAAPAR
jgi:signal peptidase I